MLETPEVTDQEVDEIMGKYEEGTLDGPTIVDDPIEEVESVETKEEVVQPKVETKVETKAVKEEPKIDVNQHFEFVHNGKPIKAPLSQIIKWAQQGYDYPQKMAEINKQRETISTLEKQYKPIDEWVRQNPEKWEKLQAVIHGEQQGYGELPADHPVLQKLKQYDDFINEIKNERQTAKIKEEDTALDQEIKSIQDKYKDLDWVTVDDSGRTREQAVLAHATQHGFKTFKAAFLDLYHEDLLKAAETRAKEQLVATKEKNAKTGLLPNSSAAPTKLSAPQTKGKHYPTTQEILSELGIQ